MMLKINSLLSLCFLALTGCSTLNEGQQVLLDRIQEGESKKPAVDSTSYFELAKNKVYLAESIYSGYGDKDPALMKKYASEAISSHMEMISNGSDELSMKALQSLFEFCQKTYIHEDKSCGTKAVGAAEERAKKDGTANLNLYLGYAFTMTAGSDNILPREVLEAGVTKERSFLHLDKAASLGKYEAYVYRADEMRLSAHNEETRIAAYEYHKKAADQWNIQGAFEYASHYIESNDLEKRKLAFELSRKMLAAENETKWKNIPWKGDQVDTDVKRAKAWAARYVGQSYFEGVLTSSNNYKALICFMDACNGDEANCSLLGEALCSHPRNFTTYTDRWKSNFQNNLFFCASGRESAGKFFMTDINDKKKKDKLEIPACN